jgi:hypothetical protein
MSSALEGRIIEIQRKEMPSFIELVVENLV